MKQYKWRGRIVEGPMNGEPELFGIVKFGDGDHPFGHSGRGDVLVGTKWEGRGWYIELKHLKEIKLNLENV